jgi:putative transcriptional regulator
MVFIQKRIYVYINLMNLYQNKVLVAMPNMVDSFFSKSVVVITKETSETVEGIILNKPVSQVKLSSLSFEENETAQQEKILKKLISQSGRLFFGGPVDFSTASFLDIGSSKDSLRFDEIVIAKDFSFFQKVLFGENKNQRLYFGKSVWGRGQLFEEIASGDWLFKDFDPQIINMEAKIMWEFLIGSLGLETYTFIGESGRS